MGNTTIVPLVTRSHRNVLLDSDRLAGAADNSDVQAAAMLHARFFGSASGRNSLIITYPNDPWCFLDKGFSGFSILSIREGS